MKRVRPRFAWLPKGRAYPRTSCPLQPAYGCRGGVGLRSSRRPGTEGASCRIRTPEAPQDARQDSWPADAGWVPAGGAAPSCLHRTYLGSSASLLGGGTELPIAVTGAGCYDAPPNRGVAQPGSATALGAVGRTFESCRPDFHFGAAVAPKPRLGFPELAGRRSGSPATARTRWHRQSEWSLCLCPWHFE